MKVKEGFDVYDELPEDICVVKEFKSIGMM